MTEVEIIQHCLEVLGEAPAKQRIIFDPYWWWYDQKRGRAIEMLEKELAQRLATKV